MMMYLTEIYLKKTFKDLPELYTIDQEYSEEKGIESFLKELGECIAADMSNELDQLNEALLSWFIEEGHLEK